MSDPYAILTDVTLLAVGSVCLVTDLRERKLYNVWTLGGLVAGLLLALARSGGPGLLDSLAGAGLGFLLLIPVAQMGGVAAGDVKLLMAFGALGGKSFLLATAVYGGVAGLIETLVAIGWAARSHGGLMPYLLLLQKEIAEGLPLEKRTASTKVPYGVAIIAGAVVARFWPLAAWIP